MGGTKSCFVKCDSSLSSTVYKNSSRMLQNQTCFFHKNRRNEMILWIILLVLESRPLTFDFTFGIHLMTLKGYPFTQLWLKCKLVHNKRVTKLHQEHLLTLNCSHTHNSWLFLIKEIQTGSDSSRFHEFLYNNSCHSYIHSSPLIRALMTIL